MSTRFSADRFVYVFAADRALTSGAGQVLEVYTDAECTTLATITDLDGVPIAGSTLVVGADSQLPLFLDVEDHDRLWVRPPNSSAPGTEILPTLDVLTGLIATTEAAAAVQAYLAANPPEVEPSTDAGNLLALGTDGRLVLTAAALPPVVTDHGTLSGLADDDHPQYLTNERGDARYYTQAQVNTALASKVDNDDSRLTDARTPVAHTHAVADVTGLQDTLDGLVATSDPRLTDARTPTAHTHPQTDVVGLDAALAGKADAAHVHSTSEVTGLDTALAGKAASVHTHAIADTSGLQTALDGKAAAAHAHPISDVTGLQAALDAKITGFADPNADRIVFWDDSAEAYAALNASTGLTISGTTMTVRSASDVQTGIVELATTAETITGTDTTRAVTPAGVKAVADTKAALVHTHDISDVTGLQTALDGKAAASHGHDISDVTGLQTALDGKASTVHVHSAAELTATGTRDATTVLHGDNVWRVPAAGGDPLTSYATQVETLADYPASFPPSTHTHAISDTTGLQTALDSKAASSHGHDISDVTGLQTALDGKAASSHTHVISDTTGLQTALDGKAAAVHTHAQADVTGLSAALAALSNEVEYTGSSWPARPAIDGVVKYLSTKDAAAPAPTDRQTGDLWFRHPDAA